MLVFVKVYNTELEARDGQVYGQSFSLLPTPYA